jgi:hypothetical protein
LFSAILGTVTPKLHRRYDCRVVVVSARDGAWTRDPFASSGLYRLIEEKPARWRIYCAVD